MDDALATIAFSAAGLAALGLWCLLTGARASLGLARKREDFLRAREEHSARVLGVRKKRRERVRALADLLPRPAGPGGGGRATRQPVADLRAVQARVKEDPRRAAAVIQTLIRT
jgi:hypothetical protein